MTISNAKKIQKGLDNAWNVHDHLQDKTLEELENIQKENTAPFAVCVLNLYGDLNVGIILRTACVFGAERAFIVGKKKYDKRSTVGAHKYLEIHKVGGKRGRDHIDPMALRTAIEGCGYDPVFIEQGGTPLHHVHWGTLTERKPCLIFGNESNGIDPELIREEDRVISIPQFGVLRSLNVATAASIVIHDVTMSFR